MADEATQPTNTLNPKSEPAKKLARCLGDAIIDIRHRRLPLEQQMLWNHASWRGVRIEERQAYHSPEWNYFIPVGRRAIERIVTRATQMVMPAPTWFEVAPGDEYDVAAGRQTDAVRAYLTLLLTTRIKTRKLITQWLRSLLLYHRAISKTTVQVIDAPVQMVGRVEHVRQIWPTVRAVDPFAFYVWPETVSDADDAVMFFEDIMMPWDEYQRATERGIAKPISRADLVAPVWPHYHAQRLQWSQLVDPTSTRQPAQADEGEPKTKLPQPEQLFVSLTEVWFRSEGRWMMAWLVWNASDPPLLVRVQASPYPQPPYRLALARPLPGEHYTSGTMDDIEQLQLLFNDQVNQGEESRAISALPPVKVNTNVFPRKDSLVWGPRRFWLGDMDIDKGAAPIELPDTSASAVRAAQMTLALLNSIGGGGGISEGQPARGLPRAGFAVTSLINLGMADIKDIAEIIEQEVLTPMLADLYRLTLMFVPKKQLISIPQMGDFAAMRLSVNELYGNWTFKWIGSQQAQDQQVRAQRLVLAAQMLAKVEPNLQQQGWQINWVDLLKIIWRDGLGERGLNQIITPLAPGTLPGAQAGGGAPQAGPAGQQGMDRQMGDVMAALTGGTEGV